MSEITIKHTRQLGTLVYGTRRGDGSGQVLYRHKFRPSEYLPVDDDLGDPYWYQPHSRRRSADGWEIARAKEALEAIGFAVNVLVDNTTPATGFDDLEAERYERAESRAAAYDHRAGRAITCSEQIRAANDSTYDALNGTPILVGHYSETRHRNLLDRLWRREGKAWELYDQAKVWRAKADTADRFQHRREAIGTTRRRIERLEVRLRQIDREMDGRQEVLSDDESGQWPGSLTDQLRAWEDKGIPVEIVKREGEYVTVHIGLSSERIAVLAAEVVELTEEISYWEQVLAASGAKIWTKDDFVKGDFVTAGGDRWYEVGRVSAKSLSVAGLFSRGGVNVRTIAADDRKSRSAPTLRLLPFDEVKGRMSAEEVRTRFPEAFAEPSTDESAPRRPSRKRGSVALEHSPGAEWEDWYFDVRGQRYRAFWRHPEGWFSNGRTVQAIVGDLPSVKLSRRAVLIGSADGPTEAEIPVVGPLWYVEQVHNLVREYVEKFARQAIQGDPTS